MIWRPTYDNHYGHAALQTQKYHMSFWPDGDVKQDLGVLETFVKGVQSSLVFHQNLDYFLEVNENPEIIRIDSLVNEKKLNELYEEMLNYNNITPDTVTLEKGEKITRKELRPEISLEKSLYSSCGEAYTSNDFYRYKQSCTTFSLGLLVNRIVALVSKFSLGLRESIIPIERIKTLTLESLAKGIITVNEFEQMIRNTLPNQDSCILN